MSSAVDRSASAEVPPSHLRQSYAAPSRHAPRRAALSAPLRRLVAVVELGSGSGAETREYLESVGHDVRLLPADAGTAEALAAMSPDVAVFHLAGDGVEQLLSLRETRTRLPDLPILVLGERHPEAVRVLCFQAGADQWAEAPCSPVELEERLFALLRRARSRTSGDAALRLVRE